MTGSDFSTRINEDGTVRTPAAILDGADFEGAFLDEVNLSGVDVRGVTGLTKEQLAKCRTDERTVMPAHLK